MPKVIKVAVNSTSSLVAGIITAPCLRKMVLAAKAVGTISRLRVAAIVAILSTPCPLFRVNAGVTKDLMIVPLFLHDP